MIVAKNDSLIKIKLAEVASVYFCALIWIPGQQGNHHSNDCQWEKCLKPLNMAKDARSVVNANGVPQTTWTTPINVMIIHGLDARLAYLPKMIICNAQKKAEKKVIKSPD